MSDSLYDLVIQHHASVEPVDHLVRDLLILLDKKGDPYIEYKLSEGLLFPESKTTILESITKDEAEYYQKRFREMMVETSLRPTLQLSIGRNNLELNNANNTHICPACNHQQPRSQSGMNTCQNCNLVAEKYQTHQRREDTIAQETRVHKFQQDKLMREALERTRTDEEDQLRREARLRLSLENKKRPLDIAIGVTAIALMVLAGSLIVSSIQHQETKTSVQAQHEALMSKKLEGAAGPNTDTVTTNLSEPAKEPTVDAAQARAEKPVTLDATNSATRTAITQAHIDKLKTLLEKDAPNPYLSKLSPEQFKTDQQKLARLIELNKPELAVAFVNQLTDQYAAALLLLEVTQAEVKRNHHSNDADILRTFNNLLSRAPAIQQPLVSASFSLMFHLQGQANHAHATLAPTIADLKSTDNSLLFIVNNKVGASAQTQKLGIILQIIKDYHRFSQTAAAQDFIKVAEEILSTTPTESLAQAEGMTLLASAYLVLGDRPPALAWLNKISDTAAREQLLEKLNNL